MNNSIFDYHIRSELPPNAEQPASIGDKFVKTLDALTDIDPTIFANWQVMNYPATSSLSLATARLKIASVIENNVYRNDLREPRPDRGYTAGAFTDVVHGSRQMSLTIHAGGHRNKGDTWLEAGDFKAPPDAAMITYPVFKAGLLAINTIWSPSWACAQAFEVGYFEAPLFPGAPLFPYSIFHIAWIAYLSAPLAGGLDLPEEIVTERTPNGGLLMTAVEERLDPTNPEHLRRARILVDIMVSRIGHGFSTPARFIDLSGSNERS